MSFNSASAPYFNVRQARFGSSCPSCGRKIRAGDLIYKDPKAAKSYCESCGEAKEEEMRPRASSRPSEMPTALPSDPTPFDEEIQAASEIEIESERPRSSDTMEDQCYCGLLLELAQNPPCGFCVSKRLLES